MRRKIALTGGVLMMTTISAAELGQQIDTRLTECRNKGETTIALEQCYQTALQEWEHELEQQYQLLLQQQSPIVQSQLQQAQQLWRQYQQSHFRAIELFYQQQQGTIWGIVAAESKLQLLRHRTIELDELRRSTDLSVSPEQQ